MEEHQVGITEYTTATTGFNGILKHRYEDFQVFEVDLAGRTAHLTDLSAPELAEPVPNAQLTDASIAELAEALEEKAGPENAARVKALLLNIQRFQQQQQQQEASAQPAPAAAGGRGSNGKQEAQQEQAPPLVAYLLPIKDKETRKAVHTFLKTDPRLPPLETDTVSAASVPEEAAVPRQQQQQQQQQQPLAANTGAAAGAAGQQAKQEAEALNIIRVRLAADAEGLAKRGAAAKNRLAKDNRKDNRRHYTRHSLQWQGGRDNKFLKFVLLKENMDTQTALTVVGRMLHLHSQAFGFSGTKDRRGITTQYVTLFKVDPRKLAPLNPRLRGIKLGNFEFCPTPLQLGQLRGNAFRILMRDVNTHDEQHIASAVSEVRQRGFINYFGLQRFGTGNVPTHRVGAALLRGEWKGAVELLMAGAPHEKDDVRAARDKFMKGGNIKAALDSMPTWMVAERAILQTLVKTGASNYTAALQAVPRTLRSMYMHAWQSWCWNSAASERIRRYGADRVVEGDLVLPPAAAGEGGDAAAAAAAAAAARSAAGADAAAPADSDAAGAAAAGEGGGVGGEGEEDVVEDSSAAARLAAVHVVTAEEAAAGTYSITDVVLPLPGGQVQYPQHAAGWELYCRLAAADGIMLPGETDAEYTAAAAAAAAVAAAAGSNAAATGAAAAAAGSCQEQQQQDVPAAVAPSKPRQHSVRDFQLSELSGDYRRVLHVPVGLQHRVVRYLDPNQADLLPTDLTELRPPKQQQQQQHKRARPEGQQEQEQPEGKRARFDGWQRQGAQAVAASQQQQQQEGQQGQEEVCQPVSSTGHAMDVDAAPSTDTAAEPAVAAAEAAANGSAAGSLCAAGAAGADSNSQQQPRPADSGRQQQQKSASSSAQQQQQEQRVGVILEFSLPSSCYATMLIRELTKKSTSKAAHKHLSATQPGGAQ